MSQNYFLTSLLPELLLSGPAGNFSNSIGEKSLSITPKPLTDAGLKPNPKIIPQTRHRFSAKEHHAESVRRKTSKVKIEKIIVPVDQTLTAFCSCPEQVIRRLDQTITVVAGSGNFKLPIQWKIKSGRIYVPMPGASNKFVWMVNPGELDRLNLDANHHLLTGVITVTNKKAVPVFHRGINKTKIYDGTVFDVSELFDLDSNAGPAYYSIVDTTGNGSISGTDLTVTEAGSFWIKAYTAPTDYYAEGEASAILTVHKGMGSAMISVSDKEYDGVPVNVLVSSETNGDAAPSCIYVKNDKTYMGTIPQKDAGSYTVIASFPETGLYYACSVSGSFNIGKKDISDADITLGTRLVYNGTAQTQTIAAVKVGGVTVPADSYIVTGNVGTNAGEYVLTVTGIGNCTGTVSKEFTISVRDISRLGAVSSSRAAPRTIDPVETKLCSSEYRNALQDETNPTAK